MIQRAVGFAARLSFKHKKQVLQGPPLLEMPVLSLGAPEQARLALPLFLIRQVLVSVCSRLTEESSEWHGWLWGSLPRSPQTLLGSV